jgi:hypothetical protein
MNAYHMHSLADHHLAELRTQADRERLARASRSRSTRSAVSSRRSPRRLSLGLLFGRSSA